MPARMKADELILQMYKYASAIQALIESGALTKEELGRSLTLQWMVTTPLQQIGECAWKLDNAQEDLGPEIPLRQIAALRHRLVHHYEGIDWNVAEEVVFDDVPKLVENLTPVLRDRGIQAETFEL